MGVRTWIESWPVYRQLTGTDPLGRGAAAMSARSANLTARTETADSMARSVCPYCAVGCGQRVYVKEGRVTQIEGDPDSPISRGRLCPKGAASKNLVTSELRQTKVRYRRPYGTEWEDLDLATAMDMIAGASIINVGSTASRVTPPETVVYTATKGAVDAITGVLAKELGPKQIRVNSINPGFVETEGTDTAGVTGSDLGRELIEHTVLGRAGQPKDIASVATFLASDDAAWVTGEQLTAAGGLR